MMKKIVECVPNFSEGREAKTIKAIAESIHGVEGVKLLNVEADKDYNRVVVTFVGDPGGIVEAAFRSTRAASELIDMEHHHGEHPRIGAADVVPFIPVSGVTMDECVQLAHIYGRRVASELRIPVYLYEAAAKSPERKNLSDIRKGEYEGLAEKLLDPKWKPDYGAATFNQKSGATVTGARKFLIAYNVNLNTEDMSVAQEIALRIRESGRIKKDAAKNASGGPAKIPGSLKAVKAMGVPVERFHICQVSMNLVDYEITPPHVAFEEVKKHARLLGADVTGSEIVGLVPLNALLMAGKFYNGTETRNERMITAAIEGLGLSQLAPFEPEKKVIEYLL
ncbi:MAG TPA: glutamate formimidoyltransferase [Bacteroidota bacterium]|nr:glutamate formimidoyltransferase [Bacteroidota bacterium]